MKNIIYIICTLALVATGCTKLLDQKPFAKANGESFWLTSSDAEKGIMGCYALFRDVAANGKLFEYGDLTTNLWKRPWNAGADFFYYPGNYTTVSAVEREWATFGWENYQDWTDFYKVVNYTNVAIERIAQMPLSAFGNNQSLKNKYLGEAYFMRGLTYLYLVRIWGDVPLSLTAIESTDQAIDASGAAITLPRTGEITVLKQALNDAGKAIGLMGYSSGGDAGWGIRASKAAAQALEAHIALWIASRGAPGEADAHLKICTNAIDSIMSYGNYSPVAYGVDADVKNMFVGKSSEAIFELNVSVADKETFRIGNVFGLEGKTALFPTNNEFDNNYNKVYWISYSTKNFLYENGVTTADKRANLFFRSWSSTRTEPAHDNPGLWPQITCLKKFENMVEDPQKEPGETRAFFANSNIPIFRYSEIILLGAEAYAKAGNPAKAKELLFITRNRAGIGAVTAPDSELLNEVMKERRRELIGEGQLFFDCIRNNNFENVAAMNADRVLKKGYFWPVRYRNIRKNTALVQTPYWIGKVYDN